MAGVVFGAVTMRTPSELRFEATLEASTPFGKVKLRLNCLEKENGKILIKCESCEQKRKLQSFLNRNN